MTLNQFKQLVDSSEAKIPVDREDIYKYLSIQKTNSYLGSTISDHLLESLKSALRPEDHENDRVKTRHFLTLRDELVYRDVLYGEQSKHYLEVLDVIRDSCQHDLKYLRGKSAHEEWKVALQSAVDYLKYAPSAKLFYNDLRTEYPKLYDRAISAKKLRELGCEVKVENSSIVITGAEPLYEQLSKKIESIGGLTLAKVIFSFLGEASYSEFFQRYKIRRSVSTLENDQQPQIPFGYLLNLCAKFPYSVNKSPGFKDEVNSIFQLSTIITNGIYGAQPYSQWEYILMDGDKIVKFLTDVALWDSIFSIPQCKPITAIQIALGIFKPLPDESFKKGFGFSKSGASVVTQKILEQLNNKNGPVVLNFEELVKKLYRFKKDNVEQILDLLSHNQSANADYHEPADYLKIDFNFKPLIKTGRYNYLVMDKSWCAPAYFEAISSKIRINNPKLDSELGHPIEDFLLHKFHEKGIVALTGEYSYLGKEGECDFLIESEKAIILIEVKKKVLTRKSKSGIDIEIILDLSDSVLEAQKQAARTTIVLMESGSLTLRQADGSTRIVELKGREIEKVALTQLEYGGFQDRMVMEKFLMTLLTHTISTSSEDSRVVKKIASLAAKQADWIEQYKKLCSLDSKFERRPYRSCWFYSLPQMVELINISEDNESFYKALTATKYVSTGTMDWYSEYEYMGILKQASNKDQTADGQD